MGIIRVLDEHVANLIAAGEVVERPASVVKELVENAIDAEADTIRIEIGEGGLSLIRVTDNGKGIASDDVPLAFQRHATSKVAESRDLYHIRTLGFRGEALPSIASVARVEVVTSTDRSGLGTRCLIEGGKVLEVSDTRTTRGTDIQVRDLFYNTPARLKYLKTVQTEFGHISDYLYRIALAHPTISFILLHNGRQVLRTPGTGDLRQTIAAVYGTATARGMLHVEAENADFSISGWIGKPELTRANRYGMTTIVNGRYIRSFLLQQAITEAYHTLLPVNRYPLAVLSLVMDPSLVDVNVHPAKLEVRFSKERELSAFVENELRKVLHGSNLIPRIRAPREKSVIQEQLKLYETEMDRGTETDQGTKADQESEADQGTNADQESETDHLSETNGAGATIGYQASEAEGLYGKNEDTSATNTDKDASREGVNATGNRIDPAEGKAGSKGIDGRLMKAEGHPYQPPSETGHVASDKARGRSNARSNASPYRSANAGSRRPGYDGTGKHQGADGAPLDWQKLLEAAPLEPSDTRESGGRSEGESARLPKLRVIGQMHGTYIIAENEQGLYLIDQHAAHERINYEYYYQKFGQPEQASQQLLVPITMEFTVAEAELLRERSALFSHIGVMFEPFGGNTFIVRSVPEWIPRGEETELLQEIVDWVLSEKTLDVAKLREKSAIMTACKASLKANDHLTPAEIESLLDQLALCASPFTCPHGRPIIISFSVRELEKMFKRIM